LLRIRCSKRSVMVGLFGDGSDWIAAGGTKEQLEKLIEETPQWAPQPATQETEDQPTPENASHFFISSISAAELKDHETQKPLSVIGDGVLTVGGLAIWYGPPGVRKTWGAIDLSISTSTGADFFGIPVAQTRTGFLSLELPLPYFKERLEIPLHDQPWPEDLIIAARPDVRGVMSIDEETCYQTVTKWIKTEKLGFVILDALSRIHGRDESFEGLSLVLRQCDRLREETSAAILLIHHERKPTGMQKADDDMAALRGSTRLASDPTLLMRLVNERGVYCLRFVKVSLGLTPEPIYLEWTSDGFETTDKPLTATEAKAGNLERVKTLLRKKGSVTTEQVANEIDIADRTARQYLKDIGAESSGRGTGTTWRLGNEQ
ncbi:AAA family ATPase, partial [Acidobacteriota bacterium]